VLKDEEKSLPENGIEKNGSIENNVIGESINHLFGKYWNLWFLWYVLYADQFYLLSSWQIRFKSNFTLQSFQIFSFIVVKLYYK